MTNKRSTKKAIMTSLLSLVLCFSTLVGVTFAWFTDSVKSESNIIQAGHLKVEMYWAEGKEDPSTATWKDASRGAIFNKNNWEPGYTEVRHIKIANAGSLSLQYKVVIVANGEVSKLADVIDVYYVDPAVQVATREALANAPKLGTLTEVLAALDESGTGYLAAGENDTITLALKMQESAGNEYQKLSLCEGGFTVQVIATQATGESDSFGNDYDKNAVADFFPGFQGGFGRIAVPLDEQRYTTEEVTVEFGDVTVVIPVGVKLAEGFTSLTASVETKNASESNVQLNETEKMRPSDVHIEGVAEDNAIAMLITLKHYLTTGLNSGALTLYHVEDGTAVPMTHTATPANHNEFTYDPATGDVTLALASFSEVAVVADTNNPWDGETLNYLWYDASATELTIYNADQLAGFAAIVDGKAGDIAQDSFKDKTVKLGNNIYLSGKLFDPIGWGYVNTEWNRNGAAGKVFQGTFNGDGNTIFDLYQNGWDLEVDGADYTYTNCGFGLFAAASGATFKNLTISGAYVRAECVEMGILVGLSQNNCTYQNIKVLNSKIANYQRPAGGLIGEVSGNGTTTIENVIISDDVVVGSLWGDFDAPVGGVIGAYWNDVDADPQIYMTNVDVGCRLDVYNDITSAYQWHAYRRAGMLIGNTDMSDPNNAHKAYASFLHCSDVRVHYGDWVNYTYCSFSNASPRYPWVRTQAGENCEAFSNPRWGVPNDANGNRVTDMNHVHAEGDECNVPRQFSQLYGGGQGVYGQDKHDGVTYPEKAYSITYVNDGKTLDVIYVTDNTKAVEVGSDQADKLVLEWAEENMQEDYNSYEFGGWMNAASIKLTEIPADNTKNIVLYPYFTSPYTASFIDQNGNILAWCFFNEINVDNLQATFTAAKENNPDPGEDFKLIHWRISGTDTNDNKLTSKDENNKVVNYIVLEINNLNWEAFKGYKDVTITPFYRYKGADLIEVIDELTGEVDHYQVAGYAGGTGTEIVEIPDYVNGKPVTTVNADAFSSYDHLHSVRIPGTVTIINSQSFTANNGTGRDTVTLYYEGDPAVWNEAMEKYNKKDYSGMLQSNWDNYMGESSCVFFLDENGKVDLSKGYWELAKTGGIFGLGGNFVWQYHDHAYGSNSGCGNEHNNKTVYTNQCKCDLGMHDRADAEYWEGVTVNN